MSTKFDTEYFYDEEDYGRGRKLNKNPRREERRRRENDRYASFYDRVDDQNSYDNDNQYY